MVATTTTTTPFTTETRATITTRVGLLREAINTALSAGKGKSGGIPDMLLFSPVVGGPGGGVKITYTPDWVKFSEVFVGADVAADDDVVMPVMLPLDRLIAYLGKLPPHGLISIDLEGTGGRSRARLSHAASSLRLPTMEGSEYPGYTTAGCPPVIDMAMGGADEFQLVTIMGANEFSLMERVTHAASRDVSRPSLNGIHVLYDDVEGVARYEATDGYRMARIDVPFEPGKMLHDHDGTLIRSTTPTMPWGAIILPENLAPINQVIKATSGSQSDPFVTVHTTKSGDKGPIILGVHTGSTDIQWARIVFPDLAYSFPDLDQLLRSMGEYNDSATIERERLIAAIKLVAIVSKTVQWSQDGERLKITAEQPFDNMFASDYVAIESEAEMPEFRFNSEYVLDCLQNIQTAEILIRWHSTRRGEAPIQISPVGEEGYSQLSVIMPMVTNTPASKYGN